MEGDQRLLVFKLYLVTRSLRVQLVAFSLGWPEDPSVVATLHAAANGAAAREVTFEVLVQLARTLFELRVAPKKKKT